MRVGSLRLVRKTGNFLKPLRKVTPLGGWRKFVGEVGVIILGVLIALGLGALASGVGWWNEVRQARDALRFELSESMEQVIERIRFSRCVEKRLDDIARIVDEAASTGRLRPLGDIGAPAFRSWPHGVGEGIVNSGVATHFDPEELGAISSLNEFFAILADANQRELDVWTRLHALVGPGRAFVPAELAELRLAIGEARLMNRRITLHGMRAMQTAHAYRVVYDNEAAQAALEKRRDEFVICQDISPNPPSRYGQAPLPDIVNRTWRTPVRRPGSRE
jgi:hypothetical protein